MFLFVVFSFRRGLLQPSFMQQRITLRPSPPASSSQILRRQVCATTSSVLRLYSHAFLNLIRIPFHASGVPADRTRTHPSKRVSLQQPSVTRARVCCLGHPAPPGYHSGGCPASRSEVSPGSLIPRPAGNLRFCTGYLHGANRGPRLPSPFLSRARPGFRCSASAPQPYPTDRTVT